jgi:hypothetical protein
MQVIALHVATTAFSPFPAGISSSFIPLRHNEARKPMAEENLTAADARHSPSWRPDKPKTHPAILALAWLIGRGMARERFANATDAKSASNSHAAKSEPPGERAGDDNSDTS